MENKHETRLEDIREITDIEDKIHAYRIGFHENDLVALLH
jgi:hypothetical protein